MESQTSLTGNPLSLFTGKFRDAALAKTDGEVFYTDIISTLRDYFLQNDSQTPHFIAQHTGREQFVDDASKLNTLRKILEESRKDITIPIVPSSIEGTVSPSTLLERLQAADARVVTPDLMSSFVGNFFDDLIKQISTEKFADFFELEKIEHAHFDESTAKKFIIRVLSNEHRPDNFVNAEYLREPLTRNPLLSSSLLANFDPQGYKETWNLNLNCVMQRTQIKFTFTPKFMNLQRIKLVVTCAPSLDHCYLFEIATQHMFHDFGSFDSHGPEISRRWWKCAWREGAGTIASRISDKLSEAIRHQLESAEKRLAGTTKR
jgi:hypothetical protein